MVKKIIKFIFSSFCKKLCKRPKICNFFFIAIFSGQGGVSPGWNVVEIWICIGNWSRDWRFQESGATEGEGEGGGAVKEEGEGEEEVSSGPSDEGDNTDIK